MTTAQQRRLYFPAWQTAAKNHGWTKGQLAPVPFFGTPMLNPIYQRIVAIANERITAEGCATKSGPCGEHFRHACHIVTFGQDKSSAQLINRELDRILALFKLLADPDDLAATLAWNNPNEEARKRMLWWLRKNCVESYIVEVSRQRFHTDNWESLDYDDLRKLHMTVKNRPNAQRTRHPELVNVSREVLECGGERSETPLSEDTETQPF